MATKTSINKQTVVHKESEGVVTFTPDVCLTPIGPTQVPVPYANTARSADTADGSRTVKVDNNPIMLKSSVFSRSTGDEAGILGGVSSGVTCGKAEFINYSFDVMVEGKEVPRLGDHMLGNKGSVVNTPPMPEMQPACVTNPQPANRKPDSLDIQVVDSNGNPWNGARYRLMKPDTDIEENSMGSSGKLEQQTIEGIGVVKMPYWPYAVFSGKD